MFLKIYENTICGIFKYDNSNAMQEGETYVEVSDEVVGNIHKFGTDYYTYVDGQIVENPDYEAEQALKERERLNMLSLTAADVERATYKAKGMDFEDILDLVQDNPEIDSKALKIELKANNFYRGNPWIDTVGSLLGYSSEDLDYLFENKEFASEEPDE